jgi:hypothetical protein
MLVRFNMPVTLTCNPGDVVQLADALALELLNRGLVEVLDREDVAEVPERKEKIECR